MATESRRLLVTGATGLVGSHVAEHAASTGWTVRALVRPGSRSELLKSWGVELVEGHLEEPETLPAAVADVTHVVHCAAKVGDWGPVEDYRRVNVGGLGNLLEALSATGSLQRFVHISSLGVYEARDHYGTDESETPNVSGIDGYTLTKVESEQLVLDRVKQGNLPAVVLRPGFVYGPRDRTVLPRLLERLRDGKFAYLGSGKQLLNNVFVGNVVSAVWLALERDDLVGEVFNITDPRLVTRHEFIESIVDHAGLPRPTKHVPLAIARPLASILESTWRLLGKTEAPLLSQARIKFLGLHLDYSIDRARQRLGYQPEIDFQEGIERTMDWARDAGLTSK